MDATAFSGWLDLQDVAKPWVPGMHWGKRSTLYVKVTSVAIDDMQASAILVDPCLPRSLGEATGRRSLLETKSSVMLQGNHVDKLQVNGFYVLYGTLAPVQVSDHSYRVAIPKCSFAAGISKLLGARLPWDCEGGTQLPSRVAVAELFCGGVGGWSYACRKMDGFEVIMALDSDPVATKWFAINNGGSPCLQGEYFKNDLPFGVFPIYTCDISDRSWYQTFLEVDCEMFTISFPCTPWSSMGSRTGLNGDPGQALIHAITAAKTLQPAVLAFENVPGFRSGVEFEKFVQQLQFAGFQIMYATMDDLANYSCCSRRRWVAVAINTLHLAKPQLIQGWARPPCSAPGVFEPVRHTADFENDDLLQAWMPSDAELSILKRFPVRDDVSCPTSRIVSSGGRLPTFTASYRKSLSFSPAFLQSRGLHAWLVCDGNQKIRWFTPLEAAVTMGFAYEIQLPADPISAVHLVGNAIAPPHAALALHYTARMLAEQTGASIRADFKVFLHSCGCQSVDFRGLCIVLHEEAMFLSQKRSTLNKRPFSVTAKPSAAPGLERPSKKHVAQEPPAAGFVADTLPFPDTMQGDLADGRPSGFLDPSGTFKELSPPSQPVHWKRWIQSPQFAKEPGKFMVSFRGEFLSDDILFLPGFKYVVQFHKVVPGGPGPVSGAYDVAGDFHALPTPTVPILWKKWLCDNHRPCPPDVWVTADGAVLSDTHVLLPGKSQLLRFRARMRGGTKDSRAKLRQHLIAKGVSPEVVQDRINSVMEIITDEQLANAYKSLEPWATLKELVGNRLRLVTQDEFRLKKKAAAPARSGQIDAVDPWLTSDPWSEAKGQQQEQDDGHGFSAVELIPDFFSNEDGTAPELLTQIQCDAKGLCLLPVDQAMALADMKSVVSADECAAVVLGSTQASLGSFPMQAITFPAKHCSAGKVLLKGVLINYGARKIALRKSANEFHVEPKNVQVLTFEIPKDHTTSWDQVLDNPLRFIWKHIDKSQSRLLSTWSRKFFHNRAVVAPSAATSFHCFGKALKDDVQLLLTQSGCEGIYITPKAPDGTPDGMYRIVWLETNDRLKATALARSLADVVGVVRGRNNLGLRVLADHYTSTRQFVEPGWENTMKIRYQVRVSSKYVLSPLAAEVDREALQKILDAFSWSALPLRPRGRDAWIVGADQPPPAETIMVAGTLVLIVPLKQTGNQKASDSVVVAAPDSVKKSLDRQISNAQHYVPVTPVQPPLQLPLPRQDNQLLDLKGEFDGKLKALTDHFNSTVVSLKEQIQTSASSSTCVVDAVKSEIAGFKHVQDDRIRKVEEQVQSISSSLCTKADMSALLQEALSKQSAEFRQLMAKRSPDPSPAHGLCQETKIQKTN